MSLNVLPKIDETKKHEIWQKLIIFNNESKSITSTVDSITFDSTYSNLDRLYVHVVAKKLGLTSKSYGNKRIAGARSVVVTAGDHQKKQDNYDESSNDIIDIDLNEQQITLIQSYMRQHTVNVPSNKNSHNTKQSKQHKPRHKHHNVSDQHKQDISNQLLEQYNHRQSILHSHEPQYKHERYMYQQRCSLPVYTQRDNVINAINNNQIVLIQGSTGSGKSTQIPQYILEHSDSQCTGGYTNILVTQPRRIAAISLCDRVNDERCDAHPCAAYQIRLDSSSINKYTRVTYCTVGIVLRRLIHNRSLNDITHLVIDEIHERDKLTDFLLIIIKQLLAKRRDIKLIMMSATMNVDILVNYFNNNVYVCNVPGFIHPVHTLYLHDIVELTGYRPDQHTRNNNRSNKYNRHDNTQEHQLKQLIEQKISQTINGIDNNGKQLNNGLYDMKSTYIQSDDFIDSTQLVWDEDIEDWIIPNNTQSNTADNPPGIHEAGAAFNWKNDYQYKSGDSIVDPTTLVWDDDLQEFVTPYIQHSHNTHQSQPTMEYSHDTNRSIEQLTSSSGDIDYGCIIATIQYICTKFDMQSITQTDGHTLSDGSVLVFVPGWDDISELMSLLSSHPILSDSTRYKVLPLHGSLSAEQQRDVFHKCSYGQRKLILSTNVAESSITIDDVVFVIDSGRHREKTYDAITKLSSLDITWISQANAQQRMGRAGRLRRGICIRMYTQQQYNTFQPYQLPELLRSSLEEVCMQVKLMNLGSIQSFLSRAVQPPNPLAVSNAIELLVKLGALTASDESLTVLGRCIADIPTDPRLAKLIIYGALFHCVDSVTTVTACLSYRNPFILPYDADEKSKADTIKQQLSHNTYSDLITLMYVYHGFITALQQSRPAARTYCGTHYLSFSTMMMIKQLKQQYIDILNQNKLINNITTANQYNNNLSLIRALIGSSLYPYIVCINQLSQGKKGKSKLLLNTRDNISDIAIHPSSVNKKVTGQQLSQPSNNNDQSDTIEIGNDKQLNKNVLPSRYMAYYEATRSSNIYLSSTTLITPLTLLLMCGHLQSNSQIDHSVRQSIQVDEWLSLQCNKQHSELLIQYRHMIDDYIYSRLNHTDTHNKSYGRLPIHHTQLLNTLIKLLSIDHTLFDSIYTGNHTNNQQYTAPIRQSQPNVPMCKFYQANMCTAGPNCKFLHNRPPN